MTKLKDSNNLKHVNVIHSIYKHIDTSNMDYSMCEELYKVDKTLLFESINDSNFDWRELPTNILEKWLEKLEDGNCTLTKIS